MKEKDAEIAAPREQLAAKEKGIARQDPQALQGDDDGRRLVCEGEARWPRQGL